MSNFKTCPNCEHPLVKLSGDYEKERWLTNIYQCVGCKSIFQLKLKTLVRI